MSTIYVWVLVIYMSGGRDGGPTMIDNISTMQECQRVSQVIRESYLVDSTRCIQVQKVK